MTTFEQSANRPNNDPQATFDFLETFRERSGRVRSSLDLVAANPSRQTMGDFRTSMAEAREAVLHLYQKEFFRDTRSPIAVRAAVTGLTDSVRDTMACLRVLSPEIEPRVIIRTRYTKDPRSQPPRLEIALDDFEDIEELGGQEGINQFADLILKGPVECADEVSEGFMRTSNLYYGYLEDKLYKKPAVRSFLEKEARKEHYTDLAKKGGGIALSAFAGTLAANLLSRKHNQ